MMFEGLKKTVTQNFLFLRVLLSKFMCSKWFFTRTGFNSCFIGFLMPSNVQDLILVIESRGGREYFMESAGVRYLRTNCWSIRNRTSELSERVRFLIQKQRVRKYCTKHFPCGIVFIIYMLRHSSFSGPFYFRSFKNAKICRYTLPAKWQRKRSISFLVITFVKNINDVKDMR